jgi:hypothetical protein
MLFYMHDNKVVPPQLLPGYKTPEGAQALLMQCLKDKVPFPYTEPKYTDRPLPTVEQYSNTSSPRRSYSVSSLRRKEVSM